MEKLKNIKGCFGVPLKSAAPQVICDCIEYIKFNGIDVEGIFRIPGQQDMVELLKIEYNEKEGTDILSKHKLEVHDVATLFKSYFRSLPTPLVPFDHYETLMNSVRSKHETKEALVLAVQDAVLAIPSPERECLGYIIKFLKEISLHSETNKMNPANLATCFAPSLLAAPIDISPQQALMDMSSAIGALNVLIKSPDDLPQPSSQLIQQNTLYKPPKVEPPPGLFGAGAAGGPPPGLDAPPGL